jgi:hypothetical protein
VKVKGCIRLTAAVVLGTGVLTPAGVPANPLRTLRPIVLSPKDHVLTSARHLRNYARVEIPPDGAPAAEPAAFTLPRDTRVVVLEMKVERDAVRLFTHTLVPVALLVGRSEYGCTEFVFRFDPGVIKRADTATVERAIERWLARTA